jgi:hypothetical protein
LAKQPPKSGMSRIRFIMVEAEIADGELSQITAAIQNALKPATIMAPRATPQLAAVAAPVNGDLAVDDPDEAEEAEIEAVPGTASNKPRRVRKPTTPEVLDVDMTSDVSLEAFVAQHPVDSEPDKNLVIAAWFKEHRNTDAVKASHIYTAYRQLKWPAGFDDFTWPLRYLKKDQYMVAGATRGEYSINRLGLDRVRKMNTGA